MFTVPKVILSLFFTACIESYHMAVDIIVLPQQSAYSFKWTVLESLFMLVCLSSKEFPFDARAIGFVKVKADNLNVDNIHSTRF